MVNCKRHCLAFFVNVLGNYFCLSSKYSFEFGQMFGKIMRQLLVFDLMLIFVLVTECKITYKGFSLFRIVPHSQSQLQYLLDLNANTSSGLDFWLRTTAVNKSADVLVFPWVKNAYIQEMKERSISFRILIPDLGRLIEEDGDAIVDVPEEFDFFSNYQPVDEMQTFMLNLFDKYYPKVKIKEIGLSFEGRSLLLLKISSESRNDKPAIWIQSGAHAREMVGPPTVLFIALKLATSGSEEVHKLIEAFDWYIYPMVNPDGYEYARKTDRLWRKTRSFNEQSSECYGADANRNWDFQWSGTAGASTNPCSHNYAGTRAFSEPETSAIAEFVQELKGRLYIFIDFHNYSQRWLTPWGYTSDVPANYRKQKEMAEVATAALQEIYGTKYSVGSSGNIMYTVTGGARDWMHGVMDVPFSYVVELRDNGDKGGFLLPRNQILPTAEETWLGVKAMSLKAAEAISV